MTSIARYLPALLILSACGHGSIDPAFTEYVTRFESSARDQGKAITVTNSIRFGIVDSHDGVQAVCDAGVITVDRNAWNGSVDLDREEIIFHELGHCTLGRQHLNDTEWDASLFYSVATSIMNLSRVDLSAYSVNRSEYIKELFHE
jgi:hypothetical protein